MSPSGDAFERVELAEAQEQLARDLRLARHFTEQTATAATFVVPDRDGDGVPETIRYAWSGNAGDPLTFQINGGSLVTIKDDVDNFALTYHTRLLPGRAGGALMNLSGIAFRSYSDNSVAKDSSRLTLMRPEGTVAGDFMIAVVSFNGEREDFSAPSGWTRINLNDNNDQVTLGIWYRFATSSEPASYRFYGFKDENGYGYIMSFVRVDPGTPLGATAYQNGKSVSPIARAVTTTRNDCMVLRILATKDDKVFAGRTGLNQHVTILMGKDTVEKKSSSGAAYKLVPEPGVVPQANFQLTDDKEYRSASIVIHPDES